MRTMTEAERLKQLAREDGERAEELQEDNPTAAGYYERRADWRRYLARDAEDVAE